MNKKEKLICIGRITKAHGIKGELVVDFYGEEASLLKGYLFLSKNEEIQEVQAFSPDIKKIELNALRQHHGKLLIVLKDITTRNQAEDLKNFYLFIPESKLPELSDGEVYLHAILGANIEVEDKNGRRFLGVLESVDQSSGQELWEIITNDEKEVLFPAVSEFIKEFDLDNNLIIISPPEGLLDLYLTEPEN
ncbi:ribosome maturation factor RimM [Desulfovibrio litoralis]|uniref:Ribosome maturation factor RimM n=1 Tax=Desulfovibrio litoralis DSM 11393 TaxID=1121455 RepID=A0A1M7SYG4_9BACT|nr:ribosome maturation factor RimM [Desulfovibrio litoralis]SHN63529.1 16S rRNA processing protein RimM [Desulfovibrio litoralis DSM 11393]